MNKYQIARHESNELVVKEAENHPELTNSIPRYAQAIAKLKVINGMVNDYNMEQSKEISGATTEKNNSKVELIDWTIEVAGAVHSYAVYKKDVQLMAKSDYNVSDIEQANRNDLLTKARIVLQLAKLVPDNELRNEGILPENLHSFEEALNMFDELKTAPREASIDRSGHTDTLSSLFSDSNDLLKGTIDKLLPQFRRKNIAYYNKMKAARALSKSSSRKKGDDSESNTDEAK